MPTKRVSAPPDRVAEALKFIKRKHTYREAAQTVGIARSTLHERMNASGPIRKAGRRPNSTPFEENIIVGFLVDRATAGLPLTKLHLSEAVNIFVSSMSSKRRCQLGEEWNGPSREWLNRFPRKHADRLSFVRPLPQEAVRYRQVNGEAITTHFATVQKLVEDNEIDASRLFNLDECGCSPAKEAGSKSRSRRYMPRRGSRDIRRADIADLAPITMMPVISAAGEHGPPLLVFKVTRIPYRVVLNKGICQEESPLTHLPRHSVMAMREKNGRWIARISYLGHTNFWIMYRI